MNKKGFTLVEILAVIAILGILVTIAMTAVVPRINQSRKESFIMDAKNMLKIAKGLYVEQDALNSLPKTKSDNEGIIKYKDSSYFYIRIADLAQYMDNITKNGYDGYITIYTPNEIAKKDDIKFYIQIKSNKMYLADANDKYRCFSELNIYNCSFSESALLIKYVQFGTVNKINKTYLGPGYRY